MSAKAQEQGTEPGAGSVPLRLWLADDSAGVGRMCVLRKPFRLGFGAECDIRLQGDEGPAVLFEVEQARGPLLVARTQVPAEFDRYVDLRLDGMPLNSTMQSLAPGSRLEIVDKASGRRYHLVLSPTLRTGLLRPRNLAMVMLVLALVGAGFGGYLYWSLEGARTEISRTGTRVERAEAGLERTTERLLESIERIETTEAGFNQALEELRRAGAESTGTIRAEFAERIQRIERSSRDALAHLEEQDVQGREALVLEARRQADDLRGEFSDRMVESYRQLQALEQRMLAAIAERLAAREPSGERFQRIYRQASEAALLIRTRYEIQFVRAGTVSEMATYGSGFVVAPSGLAVTAQHVLFPWLYDDEFLVLEQLGLVRIVPGSTRWQVWPVGTRALRDPTDPESVDDSTAYGSHAGAHPLRLLHAPEPVRAVQTVTSPLGVIEVPMPVPGASDSAVLQLVDFSRAMAHLPPAPAAARPAALDEMLLVGYPFSRLQNGIAMPQGIRGFVRRMGEDLLELDAAVHPGLSGGPVLDRNGALAGMVMATLSSDVYAVAVPLARLLELLRDARAQVLGEERRLADMGCDPGAVDGEFDARTWEAYRCEQRRGTGTAGDS